MTDSSYTIRNYDPADFNSYVSMVIEAEKLEPRVYNVSPEVIAEHLYHPEQNLFVAEISGTIVGYMNIWPELAIGRVILGCWINPEHRRKGLATRLIDYADRRAEELGVGAVHVNVREANEVAQKVLPELGFTPIRRYLELKLDMSNIYWSGIDRTILKCRHLKPGEEDTLTAIQNRAFADTWGYNVNTVESTKYRLNLSYRSTEDVVVVCDGDQVVGYCWTEKIDRTESVKGRRRGRIFMLGVDPGHRGRGVGKKVLLAGLDHLSSQGVTVTELTVDSENKAALELYRSVGFKESTSSLWYEKVLG